MARLPILMYHSICEELEDSKGLTLAKSKLEKQFEYLRSNRFTTLHFSDLEHYKTASSLPKKSVILTFDDVYVNQLEYAYPLLKEFGFKASFFIPFAYVDKYDSWNTGSEKIMSVEQLKSLDSQTVELGLHSYHHINYNEQGLDVINADFDACKSFILKHHINVNNILAYPYGKYPRKNPQQHAFFETLKLQKIAYALRIGNRINRYPFNNNFEVQRIDIKGEDTINTFKFKLRFGKLKLF